MKSKISPWRSLHLLKQQRQSKRPVLVSQDPQRSTSFKEGNHWLRADLIPESTITFRSSSAGAHPDKGRWLSVQLWGSISEPQVALSNKLHVFDPQFHHLTNGCNSTSSSFTGKHAQHRANIGQCPPVIIACVTQHRADANKSVCWVSDGDESCLNFESKHL